MTVRGVVRAIAASRVIPGKAKPSFLRFMCQLMTSPTRTVTNVSAGSEMICSCQSSRNFSNGIARGGAGVYLFISEAQSLWAGTVDAVAGLFFCRVPRGG
jgi:hypothetical protein